MTDFRDMTATRRSEIGRLGGLAAHEKGTAHQWTTEEAKAAGRRGGKARAEKAKARVQSAIDDAHAANAAGEGMITNHDN